MPKPIPFKTPAKEDLPENTAQPPVAPTESTLLESKPKFTKFREDTPEESKQVETTPEPSQPKEEMPSEVNEENCVVVNGQKIEIKPTKLKYFRNKGASAYGIIKAVPLHELLTYEKGVIDPQRDADQLLFDFLVSVFDDSTFVRDNYDDMDAETIDRVVKIFGRLNHVDEKEQERKNREAQAQAKH